jgi:hypothetical protein
MLARKLTLDLPGFRQAYVVGEDGRVVVSEKLEASVLAKVTNPDEEFDLPPVENAALARRIAKKESGGYVEDGDRLLVFSRMMSLPWTYVAELERSMYLDD